MVRKILSFICLSFVCVSAVKADYTNGVFFLNEDWYGHDYGTINYYSYEDDEMYYRVFREVNPEDHLGVTSQYAQIFGGKMYIMSKQDRTYGSSTLSGGRLVVVDAETLEKIAQIDEIGGADGRSFVGVNSEVGYIGTSAGIYTFDMQENTVGELIEGTASGDGGLYSDQIGDMIRFQKYVFATKQGEGVYVIDTATHELKETISVPYIVTVFVTSAGELYAASTDSTAEFVKINPETFATENVDVDDSEGTASVWDSWGAWRSGSVAVDPTQNVIYYFNGEYAKSIMKYDFDNNTLTRDFIVLPEGEENANGTKYDQVMYGTGIGIDPTTRQIVLTTTEEGWSTHFKKNWLHFANADSGEITSTTVLDDYYWFPAMPLFPDNKRAVINLNNLDFNGNPYLELNLNECVSDEDSNNHLILYTVEVIDSSVCQLTETAYGVYSLKATSYGKTSIVVTADSNGHITTKEVEVEVDKSVGIDSAEVSAPQVKCSNDRISVIGNGRMTLYSADGTIILSENIDNALTVDVSGLKRGMYILQIRGIENDVTEKILLM